VATITSNGTGGGNWATGATWVGGVKPGNTDSVVLAASDVVTYDEDMSGWANGIAGLTLGANSALVASTSAGAYYLKMAGNITASGAGAELRAGTAETAYPTDCTFTIYMNGNYSIDGGASNYLTCKFYCYDPPVKYLRLISATPKAITGISKANPCTVTCVGHGKSGGDIIYLVNVGGMVELNNLRVRVKTVLTADTFTLRAYDADVEIDSTYFTTYTSGGYVCPETAESAGQTVLEVDQDVSSDAEWTRSGATLNIDNVNRTRDSEARTLSSVSSGSVTVTAGLTAAKHSSSLCILTTRNVIIQSSSTNITYGIIYRGNGHVLRCAIKAGNASTNATYQTINCTISGVITGGTYAVREGNGCVISGIISGNSGIFGASSGSISGVLSGINNAISGCNEYTISGLITGCNNAVNASYGCSISGILICCANGINGGNYNTITGTILGCSHAVYSSVIWLTGFIVGCAYGVSYTSTAFINGATLTACNVSILYSDATIINSVLHSNGADINCSIGTSYGTLFGSSSENTGYNSSVIKRDANFKSFDHDATAGSFRAWTRGGITSSTTSVKPTGRIRSYQSVCESATYPCWHQREILVEAGRQVRIRVWGKADAGVTYKAQLVLPTDDPLVTGSGSGEWEQTMTADGSWYEYKTAWTNTATYPVTIYLRFLATAASGNAYCDFQWAFDRSPSRR